jgi:hypothetical protein
MSLIEFNLPPTIARRSKFRKILQAPADQGFKKTPEEGSLYEFGQKYHFDDILLSRHPAKKFQELVPTYDYSKIYKEWWYRTLNGVPDVCWRAKSNILH